MIYVKQLNGEPEVFSILVLDDERGSLERHSGTVQETRAKVVPYKREVQPWLHTRTSQIDGERGAVSDLKIHTTIKVIPKMAYIKVAINQRC